MKVKMILPALTEALSPFWRPIKYSLFPPLGLATLAAYLDDGDEIEIQDEHVERLNLDDTPDLVVIQVYITSAYRAYELADHYRQQGAHVALGGLHVTSLPDEAALHADTIFLGPGEDTWPQFLADFRAERPGRVYRSDSDATHTPMFHQIEALVIDRDIHLGHLKWTLETFLKAYFERDDIVLRLRPSYFPFTEPSVEVDVGYTLVDGKRVVGGSEGWMEVLGSGMVNRRVIEFGGLDPDEWQGFAFGIGVDRLAMLKYGMDDLRAFFDGDVRWLSHYGFSALDVPTLSAGVGTLA